MALIDIIDRHLQQADDPRPESHISLIFRTDEATASKLDVETALKKELADNDLFIKEFRDDLKDDAMACFNRHQRPSNGCPDYGDPSKVIGRSQGVPPEKRQYLCMYCLDGDTEIPTSTGTRTLRELAEVGSAELLVYPKNGKSGSWKNVPIRTLGTQQLWEIRLRKNAASKTVFATAEHRWLTEEGEVAQTSSLAPGQHLASLLATPVLLTGEYPSPFGVAHGFTFGDGTKGTGHRSASLTIYDNGKDKVLRDYFSQCRSVPFDNGKSTGTTFKDLPRGWKAAPDMEESRAYLLGFASGYFAADGTVSSSGQARLYSSKRENVQMFKDVLTLCGVRTNPIRTKSREGFGKVSDLHSVTFRADDLPEVFFLIEEHRLRVSASAYKPPLLWKVESVTPTDRVETVYCPEVGGKEIFALTDDLATFNCPAQEHVTHKLRIAKNMY
jgi:DNA primase